MMIGVLHKFTLFLLILIGALASTGPMLAREIGAGPIWNNNDAAGKCPQVCGAAGWDGNWRTTVPGKMSVCSCGGSAEPQGGASVGFGGSCQARSTVYCRGCMISCPAGQAAFCSEGEDFGTSGSGVCRTQPICACR
jgi:hypothetical protein